MACWTLTMYSWQMASSSAVVTPGTTWGPIMSSTSAVRRPATRILAISSGVLSRTAMAFSPCKRGHCTQKPLPGSAGRPRRRAPGRRWVSGAVEARGPRVVRLALVAEQVQGLDVPGVTGEDLHQGLGIGGEALPIVVAQAGHGELALGVARPAIIVDEAGAGALEL